MSLVRVLAYIDPSFGSAMFAIALALANMAVLGVRALVSRVRTGSVVRVASSEHMRCLVYSDSGRYFGTFGPILREFDRRGVEVTYWTQDASDPLLGEGFEHVTCECIGDGPKAFGCLASVSCDIVLSTTPDLDVTQWRRSPFVGKYVHVMHCANTAAWYRMFGIDAYDVLLLANDYQVSEVRSLEEKRGFAPKDLAVVGCPYMDELMVRVEREGHAGGTPHEVPVALVAPSWGDMGLLSRYGKRLVSGLVEAGFSVIVRPHPQSLVVERDLVEDIRAAFDGDCRVTWDFEPDNFASLDAADVMVSDMSGVIHDFALVFDKPVLYVLDGVDMSTYDAAWLDEQFFESDLFVDAGIRLRDEDMDNVGTIARSAIENADALAQRRAHARELCWAHRGESARLVVDHVMGLLPDAGDADSREI